MSTIDEYRTAKTTYLKLKDQAKRELLARFHELANELLLVQRELKEDFNVKVAIPSKPKTSSRKSTKVPPKPIAAVEQPTAKVMQLEKRLTAQKQKLEQALTAGKDTKAIRDRIYEIEDELRLTKEKA
jgi:hypothetical protein